MNENNQYICSGVDHSAILARPDQFDYIGQETRMHWSHQDTQEGWHLLCDSLIKLQKDDNNDRSSTSTRKTRSRSVGGLIGDGKSTSLPFIYVKLRLTFVGLASVACPPNSSMQPLTIIAQPAIRIKFTLPEELLPSANLVCHY